MMSLASNQRNHIIERAPTLIMHMEKLRPRKKNGLLKVVQKADGEVRTGI